MFMVDVTKIRTWRSKLEKSIAIAIKGTTLKADDVRPTEEGYEMVV